MIDPNLHSVAQRLREAADKVGKMDSANEADLRHRLFLVLGPFALDDLGLPDSDVRQEGPGSAGRFDSIFGRAILEYKSPGSLESEAAKEHAAEQALGYLDAPELGAQIVILTDGETWGILRDPEAGAEPGEQTWLDLGLDASTLPAAQRFAWRSNSVEACRRILSLITTVKAAPVSVDTVVNRLGPSRPEVRTLLGLLSDRIQARTAESREDLLFEQWIRLAGVAYGIEGPDTEWPRRKEQALGEVQAIISDLSYPEAVFVLHTYVGLSCKLLACELLALRADELDLRPSQWSSLADEKFVRQLRDLEEGHATDRLGAPGLLAGDLFGWYLGLISSDAELRRSLRDLTIALGELAWARVANAGGIASDLLRDFYQAVVPRGLRKALGEFFTPRWLAERVLIQTIQVRSEGDSPAKADLNDRILDPTCGSGTFLVAALRLGMIRLQLEGKDSDPAAVEKLLNRIIGFDINPVSVLMARVNMLLALGDRAQLLAEFRPNIYETDSLLLPSISNGQLDLASVGRSRRLRTAVGDFHLPETLCTLENIRILRDNIEKGIERDRDSETFTARLAAELSLDTDEELEDALDGAKRIYSGINTLSEKGKNGVWARIIEQAFAPLFVDEIDLVIGNPPWVSWKDLPENWKLESRSLWERYGLWQETSKSTGGIPLSDISALVAARAMETYAPQGVVGLLFPKSIQIADPGGRRFRECELGSDAENVLRFKPLLLEDFSKIKPFSPDAQNEPIALYMRPSNLPVFPFSAIEWSRAIPRCRLASSRSWAEIKPLLSADEHTLGPLHPGDPGSPWAPPSKPEGLILRRPEEASPYEWGRGFETRGLDGLFFLKILSEAPLGANGLIRVRNLPEAGTNTSGEEPREGVVEPDLVWPLVKGEHVQSWRIIRENMFCIVAHDVDNGGEVLSVREVMRRFPNLYDFVEPWIPRFRDRSLYRSRMDGNRPWGLSGPMQHLRSDQPIVVVRYISTGGRPEAAVLEPKGFPKLGRMTVPLPNNKTNMLITNTADEAHYLCAWVNSTPAQDALARFAAATGITPKALRTIPIPRYSEASRMHIRLAELSRAAHAVQDDLDPDLGSVLHEIDSLVREIGPTQG